MSSVEREAQSRSAASALCESCESEAAQYVVIFGDGSFFRIGGTCLQVIHAISRDGFTVQAL